MGIADIPFHTFSLPAEQQLKVLLRGVPSYNSEDSVKSELELQGYTVSHVHQFLKNGRKLPMYMVCILNSQDSKHIFELTNLFYVAIRVEAYKTIPYNIYRIIPVLYSIELCSTLNYKEFNKAHCKI
jgi:hypothetical protein